MIEQAVSSLAILKTNWDKGRSYVDNFVPFVVECLRTANDNAVAVPELQRAVSETFGIIIPQSALKVILGRVFRAGFVKFQRGIYVRTDKFSELPNILAVRDDALRRYEVLISKLEEFCKTKYQVDWSKEQAETALLSYLEEHSISILTASMGEPLILSPNIPVEHANFLIKSFVVHLYERDPDGFSFLETVVKGRMLANVLFLPDITNVNQRIRQLELYLDTRFVIRLLGLSGPHLQTPCQEMIDVFEGEKVSFAIFDHTMSEIYGVLDATAYGLKNTHNMKRAYGETVDYFINQNKRSSDVEFIISRLPTMLSERNIKIVQRPTHTIELGLDEAKFIRILQAEVRYQRKDALQHDIDAITAIHRLRQGQSYRTIESCKSIFVTTNASLARATTRFFKEEYQGVMVPLCTLDNVLATIMWVKKPITAPDLPTKRIIADCYAALNPQDNLWKLYLDEINNLQEQGNITEDDYHLLRYSSEARTALMDVTLGSPNAFVEGTVLDVLNKAREAVRAEKDEDLRAEQQRRIDAENKTITQGEIRLRELTNLKTRLDRNAQAYAKRMLWLHFGFLVLIWLVLFILVVVIGWHTMEPWTYFLGGFVTISSYLYFAISQKEFTPGAIYQQIVLSKQQRNYQEFGFDLSAYEQLRE